MGDSGEPVCSECPQAVVAAATGELCSLVHWGSSAKAVELQDVLAILVCCFAWVWFAFSPQIPYDILATGRV